MSDKKFTVRSGARVRVELPAPVTADTATLDERQRGAGLLATDDDSARYVFRGRPGSVAFYDLGTRLRSVPGDTVFDGLRFREMVSGDSAAPDDAGGRVSEYIEIRAEAAGTYVEPGESSYGLPLMMLSDAEAALLERALLGRRSPDAAEVLDVPGEPLDPVDPFGFTPVNGSGRSVGNCQELTAETFAAAGFASFVVAAGLTREARSADDDILGQRQLVSLPRPPVVPRAELEAER